MASQTAKGSGKINNNGGTVIQGGNYDANGPITNDLKVKDLNVNAAYGSQVLAAEATSNDFTDPNGLTTTTSGTLAYTPNPRKGERNFILRAAGTESAGKINNQEADFLNVPGSEYAGVPRGKANVISGSTRLGRPTERTWTYPILPGSGRVPGLTRDPLEGSGFNFVSTTGNVPAVDKATEGTRSVPGEVTYRTGAPVAVTSNLKARDAAEQA